MLRLGAATAVALACAGVAHAGEALASIGYDDVFGRHGDGAASIGVQVQTDPRARLGPVGFGVGAGAEVDTDGDLWAGAGVTAGWPLRNGFRIDASVMAGGYAAGDAGEDLGSGLEFRSRLGASAVLRDPWRVGLAIEHKSNGGIGDINPGVETLLLTFGRPF